MNQEQLLSYNRFKKENKEQLEQFIKDHPLQAKQLIDEKTSSPDTPPVSVKKAIFPSMAQQYEKEEADKKNAARYNLVNTNEKPLPPLDANIKHNIVTDSEEVKLRVEAPSFLIRQNNAIEGLLKSKENGNGYRKVAKLLIIIGLDKATEVMKFFSQEEIEKISAEMATIHSVEKEEADEILKDFYETKERASAHKGGVETAKELLVRAFGSQKGLEKFEETIPKDLNKVPFEFLEDIENFQIFEIIKEESPLVIATVLNSLKKEKASALLKMLDPFSQVEVSKRIAKMDKLDNEALMNVEFALKEKLRLQGKQQSLEKDGTATLANILKYMNMDAEQEILSDIELTSAELSKQVKEKLFSIDMLPNVLDQDLQKVLQEYSDAELATILKGKNNEISEKILSNVSKNRAATILQEKDILGFMKKSEVDEVTRKFLLQLRRLQLIGEIAVKMPGEKWL